MKRKLIRQGHNTLTITIPSKWAQEHNLCAGDEINLEEKDNGLYVNTQAKPQERKAIIDIAGLPIPAIWKYLMGAYREGYSEIKIQFPDDLSLANPYKYLVHHRQGGDEQRYNKEHNVDVLQRFVDRFIGMEIVTHGKNYVIVKDMSTPSSKEFDNAFRRVFLLISNMASETLQAIEDNNPEDLAHIHSADINLDKFHDYCQRILNSTNLYSRQRSQLLASTLYLLELVGDEIKNISADLKEHFPKSRFDNVRPIAKACFEQWQAYQGMYFSYDDKKLREVSEKDKQLYMTTGDIHQLGRKGEREVAEHFRTMMLYFNALVELRVQMQFVD